MPRAHVRSLFLLALAAAGCSTTATEPEVQGGGPPPAVLVATYPVARSNGVVYDTEIWGQFDRALDPSSVSTQSVFLKLDGQRHPCTVSYEGAARRIKISPTTNLLLQRTYTVEFTPAVEDSGGTPLPPGVYFQFTTNSILRLSYDYPQQGFLEGPLSALGWGGSKGPAGEIYYEVYAHTDSLAVLRRAIPPLQRAVFTRFVPSVPWTPGARIFWSITTENILTNERMESPLQSFDVLPASVPVDSVTLYPRDFGSVQLRSTFQYCGRPTLPCGPSFNGAIHWNYQSLPADARVVGAKMSLFAVFTNGGAAGAGNSFLWMSQNDWVPCLITAPGPPFTELNGQLSNGFAVGPLQLDFGAPRLAAFLEAQARQRTLLHGMLVRTPGDTPFYSPSNGDPDTWPRVVVRFQRLPPVPPS